jgi:hypothetical protein
MNFDISNTRFRRFLFFVGANSQLTEFMIAMLIVIWLLINLLAILLLIRPERCARVSTMDLPLGLSVPIALRKRPKWVMRWIGLCCMKLTLKLDEWRSQNELFESARIFTYTH